MHSMFKWKIFVSEVKIFTGGPHSARLHCVSCSPDKMYKYEIRGRGEGGLLNGCHELTRL